MPQPLPAISLVAVPGRRRQTLDIAREIERRGFLGHLYAEPLRQHGAMHGVWRWPPSGSRSAPRSRRSMPDGRGIRAERRLYPRGLGRALPLRHRRRARPDAITARHHSGQAARRYPRLCREAQILSRASARCRRSCSPHCASGWSRSPPRSPTACYSPMPACRTWRSRSSVVPAAKRADPDFLIGNMLPVCITDDEGRHMALHRRRLERYALLPNYRNYWKEAGYGEEMTAIETGSRREPPGRHPALPDRPLARRQHALRPRREGARRRRAHGTLPASTRRCSSPTRSTATS